jgi:hypothetical protein
MDYKITSIIVCDDIRTENTGKDILIGVYRDIIVDKFPTALQKLCFRISVQFEEPVTEVENNFKILDPYGNEIISINQSMPVSETAINIAVAASPFTIPGPGSYRVLFGLNKEAEEIYSFQIKKRGE